MKEGHFALGCCPPLWHDRCQTLRAECPLQIVELVTQEVLDKSYARTDWVWGPARRRGGLVTALARYAQHCSGCVLLQAPSHSLLPSSSAAAQCLCYTNKQTKAPRAQSTERFHSELPCPGGAWVRRGPSVSLQSPSKRLPQPI